MPIKHKISPKTPVRKTAAKKDHPIAKSKPISPLGKKLMAIRKEIEESGMPLLSYEEVERERQIRRGGSLYSNS